MNETNSRKKEGRENRKSGGIKLMRSADKEQWGRVVKNFSSELQLFSIINNGPYSKRESRTNESLGLIEEEEEEKVQPLWLL